MSAPRVYGWCPGALRPMMSGDGLVVRVRAPMGRLTQEQARGVADLSMRFGSGVIDLSARANLQLRGVEEAGHPALIDGLRNLGLIDHDIAAESRRNLVIQPFWREGDDTHQIAQALTEALANEDAPDLPGKFGFAVDCGPAPLLNDVSSDIRIERGTDGLICRADGAEHGVAVTSETAATVALSLAHWFVRTGGITDRRGRMADHIDRVGTPEAGDQPRTLTQSDRTPKPGLTETGALIALEFGQMQAGTLARLGKLGAIRVTPWRMLLVEGQDRLPDLPDLIIDPTDARLKISVCTGAPGCHQGLSSTRDIARALAPHVRQRLHISGCAKGCAHPAASPVTLTATAEGRFDLIRNGRASDTPARRGLGPDDLVSGEL
ncbi:precorrin-3B synthase [Roseovarius sp. 2305UL8-3]|uniref:precorrin-3B synthase n=1 Tax=Roseovarius conchicola TaxID=3121636 RepID=UPI003528AB27